MYKEPVEVSEKITVVNGVPKEITGGMKADTLVTSAGSYPADCILFKGECVSEEPGTGTSNGWKPCGSQPADGDECAWMLCLR